MPTIDVYFDYVSPFAYIASEILDPWARENVTELSWKPIDLLALSNFGSGLPYSPSKRAYVAVDAARSAEYHRVPIQIPKPFPVESKLATLAAFVAQDEGAFDEFHHAVFRAAWAEQRHIGDDGVLADCIEAAGGGPAEWIERARSPETAKRLAESTAEAESRGVFGVPTMVLGNELFWGVDCLPTLAWRLRSETRSVV